MKLFVLIAVAVAFAAVTYRLLLQGHFEFSLNERDWQEWKKQPDVEREQDIVETETYIRSSHYLTHHKDDGSLLHAWSYLPVSLKKDEKAPVIILSHGFGGQKDFGLEPYARAFTNSGFAVVTFDYRTFGASQGRHSQRHIVNPWHHIEDIEAVVHAIEQNHFKSNQIDSSRIVLWGTSFAGGHSLVVGSHLQNNPHIKGIISHIPHLSGRLASQRAIQDRGFLGTMRVAVLCVMDTVFSQLLGFPPVYIKLAGKSSEDTSFMTLFGDEYEKYFEKHPKITLGNWRNRAAARAIAYIPWYNPLGIVNQIKVPVLFVAGSIDVLCPAKLVKEAASLATNPKSSFLEVNGSHFDLYRPAATKVTVPAMIHFIQTCVN